MPLKKNLILNFRPNSKVRFILERLCYINKNGKVISEHGRLSEFVNTSISKDFTDKNLELAWNKRIIAEKQKEIDELYKVINVHVDQVRRIKSKENEMPRL